ncbi:hypothetical protein OJF2_39730 [Aquisphaera giovannonii]|uniref:Uncharacterized protein n=1 Tax=Aquisphaera giovannonii TaxID=406548 RepID=A0A5B9W617_9BACT|nr:hypothetical protein [Aquisphaera giovannonii]QEH35421.1 hypothetical protein OJF2_39730 [Aquisphaera giovannonii]
MSASTLRCLALAACLPALSPPASDGPQPPPRQAVAASKALDGLWSGAWGGGGRNGAVMQPVIAELIVRGDRFELAGFPALGSMSGTVRVDEGARRLVLQPPGDDRGRAPAPLELSYELRGEALTLRGPGGFPLDLRRVRVAPEPMADVRVELATATGIDAQGRLLATGYTVLRAGRLREMYHRPYDAPRSTARGYAYLVGEEALGEITMDEARRRIRGETPVVIAYRPDDRPSPRLDGTLWQDAGPAPPDGEAVRRTLAAVLRPGTLVFVLSAADNVPVP